MANKLIPLSLALALCLSSLSLAEAKSKNWLIKSKSGNEIKVKDGWFGTGNKEVKSAKYGTLYENKKGVFSEQSQVNTPVGNVVKKRVSSEKRRKRSMCSETAIRPRKDFSAVRPPKSRQCSAIL